MASIDPAQFPHLSAEHRSVLTRMAQALGDQVALDVLSASPEQQIFRLEQFENFSNAQRLEGERSAQAQMQATASLTAEMLRSAAESREALERVVSVVAGAATSLSSAVSAPQTPASQTPRPRAVKIDAPKFDGADGDKLIHWLLAVERCAKAQLIDSNEQMVSYAISNLRGRASEWAFSTLLADECAFDTWDIFRARITAMYQPPNNEVLLQGRFFSLKQGKLSLERYIQEMRSLCAAITTSPLPESVKVPAFLNGLNSGPARQELYRRLPATMEDAIRIALVEQQSFRVSRPDWNAGRHNGAHHSHRAVTNERRFHGPTPMDLSSAEVARSSHWKSGERLPNAAQQPRSSRWQICCGKKRKRNVSVEAGRSTETDSIASASPTTRVVQMGSLVPGALGNKAPSEMLVYSADVKGYEKKMTVLVDCGASQNFVSKSALEQSLHAYERLVHSGKREKMIGCLGWRNIRLGSIGEHAQSEAPPLPLMKSEGCGKISTQWMRALNTLWQRAPLKTLTLWQGAQLEDALWQCNRTLPSYAARVTPLHAGSPARRCAEAGSPVCAEAPKSPDVDTGAQVCGSRAPEPAPASDSDSTGVHASTSSYHPDGAVLELRTARSRVRINRRGRRKLSARERDSTLASVAEETAASHMIAPSLNAAATSLRAFDRISDPSIDRAHVDVALRRAKRSPEANASDEVFFAEFAALHELPSTVEAIVSLEEMSYELFLTDLERDQIREIVVPTAFTRSELCTSSTADESVLESDKQKRFAAQDWDAVKGSPYFDLLWEFKDVFPDKVPSALPVDRGVRHEIDLEPGSKYCVTRQWPLPREQVEAIDEFFAKRALAGHVRESKSPHSSPTFCVRKATGGWRIVHAFNKLNAATIPAQTPIPRKDVLIDSMGGSTVFSALDLMDGFYQILMRESDVPLTAVSTPSGMLWEWLVMPQGLRNAPATFNRLVMHLLRPHRAYAPSYFDDIFVHSRAEGDLSAVDVHKRHLRSVLQCLRDNSLYCNLKKCIFGASEIPILGCYVGKAGVRADPEKIKAIADWPIPKNVKDLRKWLGKLLAQVQPQLCGKSPSAHASLEKDVEWDWTNDVMNAFIDVKESLVRAPVLALPDHTKAFSVVCDASDFAIGCALMQKDDDGHERVVSYQSRLLKAAEKNYPVHDKELLAIKYALLKFRVHLLGATPFVVYTDHASLRTAINSPHLSQRMARWLAFFSEFNFRVEYKPGKENVLADALSRRPDYESSADSSSDALCLERTPDLMHLSISRVQTKLKDNIQSLYAKDDECRLLIAHFDGSSKESLPAKLESKLARFSYHDGLLWHRLSNFDYPRVYVPHDQDLKLSILHEFHDAPASGHLGREKTFLQVSNVFWWPHQYKLWQRHVGLVASPVSQAGTITQYLINLSEQFTFHSAMKRPSDQVNREERPSSKRQRTAPELFDISPILKKKGELEFYKERFFSWRRINDRDDPNQHIAAQRDSWRTFVRLENENKMERLLRRGNARAERRTPADDRANPSSGRRSVAPGDATSSSHSCGPRREHQTPMSDEAPTCPSSVDIHATELCRSVDSSTASFLDDESVDLHDQQSTQPPSDALPESLTTGVGLNEKTIERLWKWKSAHRGQIEALQQRCSTLEERCESLENLVADHESKIDDLTEGSAQCSALESRFEERFQQVQDELVRSGRTRSLVSWLTIALRSVEEAGSALEVLRGEYHSRLQALEAVKDQSFDVLQLLYAEKNLQSDELFALRNQVEKLHDQLDRLRKIS
ncbi:Pol protein, partial [Globisporangium splendens]